jgi:hypothetical protein
MHLKVFLKLKKALKPSLLGKKPQKTQKTQKNKKTHWAGFFLYKNPGFFHPCPCLMKCLGLESWTFFSGGLKDFSGA